MTMPLQVFDSDKLQELSSSQLNTFFGRIKASNFRLIFNVVEVVMSMGFKMTVEIVERFYGIITHVTSIWSPAAMRFFMFYKSIFLFVGDHTHKKVTLNFT
jgi:hypothetical protein